MTGDQSGKSVLLCTLNAKYIHSSLALRYLQSYGQVKKGLNIKIKEFTINQSTSDIMAAIYLERPDILGFSCYIWNVQVILQICADFKKVAPDTVIVLGGPEVSYNSEEILTENLCVDYVVRGEGEITLAELVGALQEGQSVESVAGLSYRSGALTISNKDRELIADLDDLPFPYQHYLQNLDERIVYYESSRGCPFRCAYCLSSLSREVRNFSLARVKVDLTAILSRPVREIKFVDRTFNIDENRTRAIIEFIVAHRGKSKVHFEIDAGLFSESMLEFLAGVPPDLFNFEIGIQSTFEPALEAVDRKSNWERLQQNIRILKSHQNVHIHLDLIAGLPGEKYQNFRTSFDMVYDLEPDVLQLGFLKMLKGSKLCRESSKYGYNYQSKPPYQVLSNHDLSYEDVLSLTRIEELLNLYYNSGDMPQTIAYITSTLYEGQAMLFFEQFADYWLSLELFGMGHRKEALFSFLHGFINKRFQDHGEIVDELLKYDYFFRNRKYTLPEGLYSNNPGDINDLIYAYTRNKDFIQNNMPGFSSYTPREIKKHLHIEFFNIDPRSYELSTPVQLMFIYDPDKKTARKIIEITVGE